MLDYQKLAFQLQQVSVQLFEEFDHEIQQARDYWLKVVDYPDLEHIIRSKKWGASVPFWKGSINQCYQISGIQKSYQVLAIDGSQIYYDRHQAPFCYLLNVGSAFFAYEPVNSKVVLNSEPKIVVLSNQNNKNDTEAINVQREILEFDQMQVQALRWAAEYGNNSMLCLFDGSLLFLQKEQMLQQQKMLFAQYIKVLQTLKDQDIVYAGYISFPSSKELLNVVKLVAMNFDERSLGDHVLDRLTDRDIVNFFLPSGYRSNVFEMKNFLSYLYPVDLKPYFCYLHIGFEIIRLEVPAWIALDSVKLDFVCFVVLDQVQKGSGYPVCLFEAHQQAVIKNYDRQLFYQMMQSASIKKNKWYQVSCKSMKKFSMPI